MSNSVHVALLAGLVIVFILPAVLVGMLAGRRGRSPLIYIVASLLVSWVPPLLILLVLPGRSEGQRRRARTSQARRG
jgi:hypothetical protein